MNNSLYDVRAFGACGDGRHVNTVEIQAAIDSCSRNGGGKVVFPSSVFRTGTIELKDHTILELSAGCVIQGSPEISDYAKGCGKNMYCGEPEMDRCLIYANGATNIGLCGHGTIDGNGERTVFPTAF